MDDRRDVHDRANLRDGGRTWVVIMTLALGVSDAGIWILGLGSTIIRGRKNRPRFTPMPTSEDIDANDKKAPASTLIALISVNRPMTL